MIALVDCVYFELWGNLKLISKFLIYNLINLKHKFLLILNDYWSATASINKKDKQKSLTEKFTNW
jgi:hypothetical protein